MKTKTKDRIVQGTIFGIMAMLIFGILSAVVIILGIESVTGEPVTNAMAFPIMITCLIIGAIIGTYWGAVVCVNSKYKEKAEMVNLVCDECRSDDVEIYAIVKWVTTSYDKQYIKVSRPFKDYIQRSKIIPNGYCNNCQKEVEIVRMPYYTKEELDS